MYKYVELRTFSENVVKAYFLRAWDQVKDYQQVCNSSHSPCLFNPFLSLFNPFLSLFNPFLPLFNPFSLDYQSFARPRDHNLLPDLLPPPYQKPYTLILELNNVLIHTNYDVMVM